MFKTLGELRADLSSRLGFGAQGSSGINQTLLNSLLQNAQHQLYLQFDWKHLEKYHEYTTGVGQVFYDYPEDCDTDRTMSFAVLYNGLWVPLKRGITWDDRSFSDSQTVPLRYETAAQIEICPEPDQAYTLRLYYTQQPARFTQDNDRASLDDGLIFLHALANGKAHYRHPDAQGYADQVNALMNRLKCYSRGNEVIRRRPDDIPEPMPKVVE